MTWKIPLVVAVVLTVLAASWSWAAEGKTLSGPLSLEDAVNMAMIHHPRIVAARETVQAAEANYGGSFSSYYPQLTGTWNYRRTTAQGTTQTDVVPFDFYSGSVNFTQNVYDFGRREGGVELSFYNLQSAHYTYQATVNDIVQGAKTTYYGYLQARENVRVKQETVRQREELLKQAEAFLEVGTRPRIDVTRAEANLADARVQLIQAQNAVAIQRVTLANALGVRDLPAEVQDIGELEAVRLDLNDAKTKAMAQRPEILQLEATAKAQESQLKVDQAGNYPSITFNGDYGRRGTTRSGAAFPLAINWTAGLNVTLPIFTGFQTTYRVQENKAKIRSLGSQVEEKRQEVLLEVQQAHLNLNEARERIAAAEKGVVAAKENLDLATGRYQVGVGSIIEITDAQVLYVNAQTVYIQAKTDLKVAEAQLVRSIGAWPL